MVRKKRVPFYPDDLERIGGEELAYVNRPDEFARVQRHDARILKRTKRMARKSFGGNYTGTPPAYFDRWVYWTEDPLAPIKHTDWDEEGFKKGGWT